MTKNIFKDIRFDDVRADYLIADKDPSDIIIVQAQNMIIKGKRTKFVKYTSGSGKETTIAVNNKEFIKIKEDGTVSKDIRDYDLYHISYYYDRKVFIFQSETDKKEYFKYTRETEFNKAFKKFTSSAEKEKIKRNEKRRKAKIKREREKMESEYFSHLEKLPKIDPNSYLPQYIYYNGDSNHCTKCGNVVDLPNKRHNMIVNCPVCGCEAKLINKKIKKKPISDHEWVVFPQSLDTLNVLRYVLVERDYSGKVTAEELARAFYNKTFSNSKRDESICFEYQYNEGRRDWKKSRRYFFSDTGFMGKINSYFNGYAIPYEGMYEFVKSYYKYVPDCSFFREKGTYWQGLLMDIAKGEGSFYEVCLKNGYNKISSYYSGFGYYYMRNINRSGKNIQEIFDISKNDVKLLGKNPSYREIQELKTLKEAGVSYHSDEANALRKLYNNEFPYKGIAKQLCGKTVAKVNYIMKNSKDGLVLSEWCHYIDIAQHLGYDITSKSVLFPKDFRKADKKMSEEYKTLMDEMRRKAKEELDNAFIKTVENIKKAMAESDAIKEFMTDSKGLLVKIPETTDELYQEHVNLHNCLNTYIEKMAKGESTIFFIRRIEEPDKPFFAMEYKDGMIVQVHGNCNCNATPEVDKFTKKFAEVLQIIKFNALQCAMAA